MAEQEAGGNQAALYIVTIDVVCDGIVGGPALELHLGVNPGKGQVFGRGMFRHGGTGPDVEGYPIRNITGTIHHGGLGKDMLFVALKGQYAVPFGPTMPGQTECELLAALALSQQWEGSGSFSYGPGGDDSCNNARVTRRQD